MLFTGKKFRKVTQAGNVNFRCQKEKKTTTNAGHLPSWVTIFKVRRNGVQLKTNG